MDLADDVAAWLLRDSPGCIAPFVEARALDAPPKTRQITKPPMKRDNDD